MPLRLAGSAARIVHALGGIVASAAVAGCPTPKPVLPSGADPTTGGPSSGSTTTADSSSGPPGPDDTTTTATSTGPGPDSSTGSPEDTSGSSTTGEPVCTLDQRCTPGAGDWWDEAWAWRRRIDVTSPLDAPLADAVVPVRLDEAFEYACAEPDGSDLRFVDQSGAPLAHELDEWQPHVGAIAWVHVPSLEPAGLPLWLYYGNPAATAPAGEVWPAEQGYQAVLHLGGDLDDARGMHHGEPSSMEAAPLYVSDGVLGRAVHYEPVLVDARAELMGSDLIDDAIVDSHALTVTAWVRSTPDVASPTGFRGVVSRGSDQWSMALYDSIGGYDFLPPVPALFNTDCVDMVCAGLVDASNNDLFAGNIPIIEDDVVATWHHVAMVYEPLGGDMVQKRIYVDGACDVDSGALPLPMPWTTMDQSLYPITIGAGPQDSSNFVYHGEIDEVHLASEAWSPERIEAEFAFADQPALVMVGTPECM